MQFDLQGSFETDKGVVHGATTQIDRDQTRLMITPRASYSFSRNIKGGLTGSYEITNNKRVDEKVSILRLELWTEMVF